MFLSEIFNCHLTSVMGHSSSVPVHPLHSCLERGCHMADGSRSFLTFHQTNCNPQAVFIAKADSMPSFFPRSSMAPTTQIYKNNIF